MATNTTSTYDVITHRIIELLEQNTIPWRQPWSSDGCGPRNLCSTKAYRGINAFLLNCTPFCSPYFVTFKQAKQLGGSVRKGEKGFPVVYWSLIEKTDEHDEKKTIPLLRRYTVFNAAEQCEGLEVPEVTVRTITWDPIEAAQAIADGFSNGPEILHGGAKAYYLPSADRVTMPDKERFDSAAHYYGTLYHELAHATGHRSRLARPAILDEAIFASHAYSKEELISEMGSSFLCGCSGILPATIENAAAYIQNWIRCLRSDKTLVVKAAAHAQKAADHILGM